MSNIFKVTFTYNYNSDNTKIKSSANWEDLPTIHQLDALQDALGMLTDFYNDTLKEFHNGNIDGAKGINRK